MKLKPIGSNQTELRINGACVLFSYETPVAAHVTGVGFFRTSQHHTKTTSRHINAWLDGINAETKPPEFFDGLVTPKGERR